jgi:hypothetical protein
VAILILILIVVLTPSQAYAWGPLTHMHYGVEVLNNLSMLKLPLQELLKAFPNDYLYGCMAADITLKKDLVAYKYHCHNWDVALDLLKKAKDRAGEAFSWGYLTHLAADTISHNYFVPYFTVASFPTKTLKHIYWELRFDATRHKKLWSLTKEVTRQFHKSHHDELLKDHLKRTLFSFKTNKVLFNSLMSIEKSEKWHKLIQTLTKESKWKLPKADIKEFETMAMDAIYGFLNDQKNSKYYLVDPTGKLALEKAKILRKELKRLSKHDKKNDMREQISLIRSDFKRAIFEKTRHKQWVIEQ